MVLDYAAQFDAYWTAHGGSHEQGLVNADTLAEEILLACAGGSMLDLGAGQGALVRALLRLGVDAHGVDISPVAVAQAGTDVHGRFHQGSLLALPFADASFDTVIATNVLECLDEHDLAQALAEIRRVARRAVYVRISTLADGKHWPQRTVQMRGWWEQRCFEAGLRKHPSYYQLNQYEALEHDGESITILLECLPEAAAAHYPLSALVAERDLHMDMLRETGSRSDAHVARYQWAAQFIRPGDTVLDAACGLGYGSYLLQAASTARSTLGIDGSQYAYDYAALNFASGLPGLQFRCGMLPEALFEIPDHSVDVVVSFETLEHIDANRETLAQFHRILTPGGRIITSVPNDWSDETGEDPNPFHVHVYTLERLYGELETHFIVEALVAQTANQYKVGDDRTTWHAAGRSLREVPLSARADGTAPPAEWWLAVAMRSPLDGAAIAYRENNYPTFEAPGWNVTQYARDYENPWLQRSMVDAGHRLRDPVALAHLARQVLLSSPPAAADTGAALCVLAYQLLDQQTIPDAAITALEERSLAYVGCAGNPHGIRWSVSLLFVLGKLWMAKGDMARASEMLERCVKFDPISFSPLLCNRVVEAYLLLGSLHATARDFTAASACWQAGIALACRAVSGNWEAALGDVRHPAEFGFPELASVLEYASDCAFALAHIDEFEHKPWWWLHLRRDRLSSLRRMGEQLRHTQLQVGAVDSQLHAYKVQADEFSRQIRQAQALAEVQAAELAAYREQAQHFAQQVSDLQGHALAAQSSAWAHADEVRVLRAQAAETALSLSNAGRDAENHLTAAQTYQMEARQHQAEAQALRAEVAALKRGKLALSEQLEQCQAGLLAQEQRLAASGDALRAREDELRLSQLETEKLLIELADNTQSLASKDASNKILLARTTGLEQDILALHGSSSWRLTRPLRTLRAYFKKVRS